MNNVINKILSDVFKNNENIKIEHKKNKIIVSKNNFYEIVILESAENIAIYSRWKRGWIEKILFGKEYAEQVRYYNCIKEKVVVSEYDLREIHLSGF